MNIDNLVKKLSFCLFFSNNTGFPLLRLLLWEQKLALQFFLPLIRDHQQFYRIPSGTSLGTSFSGPFAENLFIEALQKKSYNLISALKYWRPNSPEHDNHQEIPSINS